MSGSAQFSRDPADTAGSRDDEHPSAVPGVPPVGDFTGLPVPALAPESSSQEAFAQVAPYEPPVAAPEGAASMLPPADPNAAVEAGIVPGVAAPVTGGVPRLEDVLGVEQEPEEMKPKRKTRWKRRRQQEPLQQLASDMTPAVIPEPGPPLAGMRDAATVPVPAPESVPEAPAPAPISAVNEGWQAPVSETASTPIIPDAVVGGATAQPAPAPGAPGINAPVPDVPAPGLEALPPPIPMASVPAPNVEPPAFDVSTPPPFGQPTLDHVAPVDDASAAPAPFGIEGTHPGSYVAEPAHSSPIGFETEEPPFVSGDAIQTPELGSIDASAPESSALIDPAFGGADLGSAAEDSIIPATGMIPTPEIAEAEPSQDEAISSGFEMDPFVPADTPGDLHGIVPSEAPHNSIGGAIPVLEEIEEPEVSAPEQALPQPGTFGEMPPPVPGTEGAMLHPGMPTDIPPPVPATAVPSGEGWQHAGETALDYAHADASYGGYTPQVFEETPPPPPMPMEEDPQQLEADVTTAAFSELSSLSATRPKVERTKTGLKKRQKDEAASKPQPIDDGAMKPVDRDANQVRSRYSSFYSGAARAKVDVAATEQNAHGDTGGVV